MVIGATIRTVRHKWRPILAVPYRSFARHSVIVGSSGSGKTNLMMRLWAGWYAAATAAYQRREGDRPLLVVLDCKGGPDARVKAERTRRLLHGVGARRVAIWPDEARLCLWDLPPRDLGVLLLQMIETGTGAAAYYTDIMQAVVNLALAAPGGPPPNAASFLDRLDVAWLETAYGDGLHEAAVSRIRAAKNHVGDIQLRYATLLGRLGPALDGPGTLDGADAWYCILEGTREQSVAEAQAMALTELVAHAATSADRERRAILLAADDYSAVSRRVPISNLYERGRSLGLGVQVSAQSWSVTPWPGCRPAARSPPTTGTSNLLGRRIRRRRPGRPRTLRRLAGRGRRRHSPGTGGSPTCCTKRNPPRPISRSWSARTSSAAPAACTTH